MSTWLPITPLSRLFHVGGFGSSVGPNGCTVSFIDEPVQITTPNLLRLYQFDLQDQDIISDFLGATLFVLPSLCSDPILVKCQYGSSRSVALITAMVSTLTHFDIDHVLSCIARCRNGVAPNPGFLWQLALYQSILHSNAPENSMPKLPVLISPGANYRLFRACFHRKNAGYLTEGFGKDGIAFCTSQGAFLYRGFELPPVVNPITLAEALDQLNNLDKTTTLTQIKKMYCTLHGKYASCSARIPIHTRATNNESTLPDDEASIGVHGHIGHSENKRYDNPGLHKIATVPCQRSGGCEVDNNTTSADAQDGTTTYGKELIEMPCEAGTAEIGFFCAQCHTLLFTDDNVVGHPGLLLIAYERGLFSRNRQETGSKSSIGTEAGDPPHNNHTDGALLFDGTRSCTMDTIIGRPDAPCNSWHVEPLNWMFQQDVPIGEKANTRDIHEKLRGKDVAGLSLRGRKAIWTDRSPVSIGHRSSGSAVFNTIIHGKLRCPNIRCKGRLGSWSWTYTPCTCCGEQRAWTHMQRDQPLCLHHTNPQQGNDPTGGERVSSKRENIQKNYETRPFLPLSPGFCVHKDAVVPIPLQ